MALLYVSVLLYLFPAELVESETSECSYRTQDGGIVSLESLASTNGKPAFSAVSADGSNIIYYYNPCYTFTENESSSDSCTPSKDIAVCQVDGNIPYNVGRQLTATFHESPVSMTGFSVMISAMAFAKLEL
jgi:hypothetical protein